MNLGEARSRASPVLPPHQPPLVRDHLPEMPVVCRLQLVLDHNQSVARENVDREVPDLGLRADKLQIHLQRVAEAVKFQGEPGG